MLTLLLNLNFFFFLFYYILGILIFIVILPLTVIKSSILQKMKFEYLKMSSNIHIRILEKPF